MTARGDYANNNQVVSNEYDPYDRLVRQYQLVEDVLLKYSKEQVVPHLIEALKSQHSGVKYWAAQIASSFPDPNLIAPLIQLLVEPSTDLRYTVIVALSQIDDRSIIGVLKNAQRRETDREITDLIEDIVADH